MAVISFREDLVVPDVKKSEEILVALKQQRDKSIRSSRPERLPDNANEVWFKDRAKKLK